MQASQEPVAEQTDDMPLDPPAEHVKELLEDHVPLSLLMDLTDPQGPHSKEILDDEGVPEDAWWEQQS